MAITVTSSPSSFKLVLVSFLFLGLLPCCNLDTGETTHEEFNIHCRDYYLKDTVGSITCVLNWKILDGVCTPPTESIQFFVSNDKDPKCVVEKMSEIEECKGRAKADGIVDCEENGNIITFHCNFWASTNFDGKKVHCAIPCNDPTPASKYSMLVTSTCTVNIVTATPKPPPPAAEKKFPTLMAVLISIAIAGLIGLPLCFLCMKRRKDKSDAEPKPERVENPEKTELTTTSGWTETTETSGSTELTTEISVTEVEKETMV